MCAQPLSTVHGPPASVVPRGLGERVWVGISGAGAVALGIAPHVLHHVGLFAGALLAGTGGSLVFGAVGFVASIPVLVRVRRRTRSWRTPMALLAALVVLFSVSTFVIGPAITSDPAERDVPATEQRGRPVTPAADGKDEHGH